MTTINHSAQRLGRSGMDLDLLRRVRKSSIIFGAVLSVPLATYFGVGAATAWLAGIAWSLVNLFFITSLMREVLTLEDRSLSRIIVTALIKFPVLYVAGFLMLRVEFLPVAWLVAGFTWPFAVLVLKGGGRAYMKMDEGAA